MNRKIMPAFLHIIEKSKNVMLKRANKSVRFNANKIQEDRDLLLRRITIYQLHKTSGSGLLYTSCLQLLFARRKLSLRKMTCREYDVTLCMSERQNNSFSPGDMNIPGVRSVSSDTQRRCGNSSICLDR